MTDLGRWLETARDWVLAVERAYVDAAVRPAASAAAAAGSPERGPPGEPAPGDALLDALAAAAAGAVASRFLAVGMPRSLGVIGDESASKLSLHAHRVWFQPSDLRCASAGAGTGGAELAAALGGRAVSLDEALAADIVCVHAPIALAAARLRRGTHVNALAAVSLDDELRARATIADEPTDLPALAAGLRDGRQLDELTVFVGGELAIARRALAARR